ncbi:MAG: DUF2460 domain-containing protein [Pseudomonadota bacterium]
MPNSAFHEVDFPTDIAFGTSGGPRRRTEIVALASGHEQRNARWSSSIRSYDAGYGVKSLDDLHKVIAFFEARGGALFGFRFRDHTDSKSGLPLSEPTETDQTIGTGDGATASFQLVKTYGDAAASHVRVVRKPVPGTVRVAVNGALQDGGTHYSVDHATGLVTFQSAHIPAGGTSITVGYMFDVPVRFDIDQITINIASFKAGNLPSIPLREILL